MPKYKGESEDDKLLREVGVNPKTLKFTPDSYTLGKDGKIKTIKLGTGKIMKKAQGGPVALKKGGKAKKKSKFPDHSGDGKITKKDILMARGVIPKTKKKMKKKK